MISPILVKFVSVAGTCYFHLNNNQKKYINFVPMSEDDQKGYRSGENAQTIKRKSVRVQPSFELLTFTSRPGITLPIASAPSHHIIALFLMKV